MVNGSRVPIIQSAGKRQHSIEVIRITDRWI